MSEDFEMAKAQFPKCQQQCGEVDEGLTDEERTVLYGNHSVAKPQGVMTVDANGKVVEVASVPKIVRSKAMLGGPLMDQWTREEWGKYWECFLARSGDIENMLSPMACSPLASAHMTFAPSGASPLSENGYDVNEPKETRNMREPPLPLTEPYWRVGPNANKAAKLGHAYFRWAERHKELVDSIDIENSDTLKMTIGTELGSIQVPITDDLYDVIIAYFEKNTDA